MQQRITDIRDDLKRVFAFIQKFSKRILLISNKRDTIIMCLFNHFYGYANTNSSVSLVTVIDH